MEIDKINSHIGKRIKARRSEIRMSQKELALKLGFNAQQMSKYESGKNRIPASYLPVIAEALVVNCQYFYEGLEAPLPQNPFPALSLNATRLLKAYYQISDDRRKLLLALVEAIAVGN